MKWLKKIERILIDDPEKLLLVVTDYHGLYVEQLFEAVGKPEYNAKEEEQVFKTADELFGLTELIKTAEQELGQYLGWDWELDINGAKAILTFEKGDYSIEQLINEGYWPEN